MAKITPALSGLPSHNIANGGFRQPHHQISQSPVFLFEGIEGSIELIAVSGLDVPERRRPSGWQVHGFLPPVQKPKRSTLQSGSEKFLPVVEFSRRHGPGFVPAIPVFLGWTQPGRGCPGHRRAEATPSFGRLWASASDAVLQTAMPGHDDTARPASVCCSLGQALENESGSQKSEAMPLFSQSP